jgi:hypothetical protein
MTNRAAARSTPIGRQQISKKSDGLTSELLTAPLFGNNFGNRTKTAD